VSNSGFDLRRMVPGRCDPWGLYRRCQADSGLAQKIGRSIGQILAEQHTQIVETDVAGWLPQQEPWPEAGTWIRERLPRVVADHGPIRGLGEVIDRYEGMPVAARDRALVHGEIAERVLARFGGKAGTTEKRRRAPRAKSTPAAGEERKARGNQQALGMSLSDATFKAVQAHGDGVTASEVLNYLSREFRMTIRPNHLGMALQRHRRAGQLENRNQRWYVLLSA